MRMSKPLRAALVAVAAAVALAAGVLVHLTLRSDAPDSAAVSALTVTQFKDLSGQAGSLEQWRGRVLVVNFWASWCPPCLEEIPGLVRIHRELAPKGLQIVGIAVDSADNARKSATQLEVRYPVLVAGMEVIDLTRRLGNRAGALPYTLILDRNGKIVATHLGLISEAELTRIIAPLLGGKAAKFGEQEGSG
jgi:thiol-disulfide isomerase/thioredoxin